jgi:hypothetical protein
MSEIKGKTKGQKQEKSSVDNLKATKSVKDLKRKKRMRGKKKKSSVSNPARLPTNSEAISNNWELLKKELGSSAPKNPNPKPLKKNLRPQKKVKVEVEPKKKPEIWFDDVDEMLLDPEDRPSNSNNDLQPKTGDGLVKEKGFKG